MEARTYIKDSTGYRRYSSNPDNNQFLKLEGYQGHPNFVDRNLGYIASKDIKCARRNFLENHYRSMEAPVLRPGRAGLFFPSKTSGGCCGKCNCPCKGAGNNSLSPGIDYGNRSTFISYT